MFTIFKEEKVITAGILVFLCLSVLVRLMLAWMYHTMIRETDNMATTGNRLLKQCKVKFANCYQLNGGVSNIPVFVDKFLNRLSFGHLSFDAWYHLSGQCMLFSVIFAGVGICKGILDGRMLGEILPFYIASFLGLYLYFSLSALVDIKGKRRVLKTNLIDYLENHLSGRIPVTEQDYVRPVSYTHLISGFSNRSFPSRTLVRWPPDSSVTSRSRPISIHPKALATSSTLASII